jgi:hypothetical protein
LAIAMLRGQNRRDSGVMFGGFSADALRDRINDAGHRCS